ncbi:MAG: hypothetical protein WA003_08640 [Desulfuromonadaceae bacterium]
MDAVDDEYTYKDCCCYQCSSFTPHNTPDCACDDVPIEYLGVCCGCPKQAWCYADGGPPTLSGKELASSRVNQPLKGLKPWL